MSSTRNAQHALVFVREYFDESRLSIGPVLQNPGRARTAGEVAMALQQCPHALDISLLNQRLQIHACLVAPPGSKVSAAVKHIRDSAAHAGREVPPRLPQDDDCSVGHVLAPVVAHALNHGGRAGIANRKALAGNAIQEDFAATSPRRARRSRPGCSPPAESSRSSADRR